MIDKNSQKSELSLLRSAYEQVGITDPLTIIEHTAFFMLSKQLGAWQQIWNNVVNTIHESSPETQVDRFGFSLPLADIREKFSLPIWKTEIEKLLPDPPDRLNSGAVKKIMELASNFFGDQPLPELFNRTLLFEFEKIQTGGRYPTPRHISDWAASIITIQPNDSLADFACGSGGFLVGFPEKNIKITGVEISPNWARLAFTNCLLHGIQNPEIHIGNSFYVFGKEEKEVKFDRILMNPPFGSKVDDPLVSLAINKKYRGRSETVLTALAYEHLSENGQMVVLLPSGSLFANSGGELELRKDWIENGELAAVITLPQDAFQPYSQVTTHAVIIDKANPHRDATWFLIARYDGYTTGRNRQEDPEHNDLPVIASALHNNESEFEDQSFDRPIIARVLKEGEKTLGFQFISRDNNPILVDQLNQLFPSKEIDFLVGSKSGEIIDCLFLNVDGRNYGFNVLDELEITDLSIPKNLNENIRFMFAEEWDFNIELTPEGGKYFDLLNDKENETITYLDKMDFQQHTGILVYPNGVPFTPAFKLPKAFEKTELGIYYWLEDVDQPGILLTIPPINKAKIFVFRKENATRYLISVGEQSILEINIEQNKGVSFGVYESKKINLGKYSPTGVVLDPEGSLIGLRIHTSEIKSPNNDCQPSSYFPTNISQSDELEKSPAEILADIQNSQFLFSQQIGKLLSIAEMKINNEDLQPQVIKGIPLGNLQGVQKAVWEALEKMVEKTNKKRVPKPFKLSDIKSFIENINQDKFLDKRGVEWDDELGVDPYTWDDMQQYKNEQSCEEEILRSLDLFERMGILIRIYIDGVPFYRLVSEREISKGN